MERFSDDKICSEEVINNDTPAVRTMCTQISEMIYLATAFVVHAMSLLACTILSIMWNQNMPWNMGGVVRDSRSMRYDV